MIAFLKQYLISIIFTALFTTGLFILFRVSFLDYIKHWAVLIHSSKKSVKKRKRELFTGKTSENRIRRYFNDAKDILTQSGKENLYPLIKLSMIIMFAIGILISFVMDNYFLLPVLSSGFCILPLIIVHSKKSGFMREFNGNFKSALSVITNSYIQNEDIVDAVETNLKLIKPPFLEPFDQFVKEAKFVDANRPRVINNLKLKIGNRIFKEWCDVLIQCCDNKELKYVLPLVVDKIDEVITVQTELDTKTSKETNGIRTLFIFDVLTLPFMFLIERDWYTAITTNPIGKLVIAFAFALCLCSLIYSIKVLKPISL